MKTLNKIIQYTSLHRIFLEKIYFSHNFKNDTTKGNETFKLFVSVEKSNERIQKGSLFYEVKENDELLAIYEIDENHLTLLYVNNSCQRKGIGSYCMKAIKLLLKHKYDELSVFASPYSKDFYLKNGFILASNELKDIKGMNYYLMKLSLN